jgi:hypothetical protein
MMSLLLGLACTFDDAPADYLSWYDEGTDVGVEEVMTFTDEPYGFPADTDEGIGALIDAVFPVSSDTISYAEDDQFGEDTDCSSRVESALPMVIEGVVTVHPRYYFKTNGCDAASDEKYYGSFFIEDATGGVFVLGDSKVAHFDVGAKVRMTVRGVRTAFDLDMVYAHDIEEIYHDESQAIYYQPASGSLGASDVGEVRRIEGVVTTDKDTFGEFLVESDDGQSYSVSLDVELNRRGVSYPIDSRVQVTGPVLLSYSAYTIIVMKKGQVSILD